MAEQCYFLALPVEIRLQIYRLLLPYTLKANSLRSTPSTPSNAPLDISPSPTNSSMPSLHRSNSMTSILKTIKQPPVHCSLWARGCTSVLATSRQVHDEAAEVLYGENSFSLMVSFDKIAFHYAWQLSTGLQPQGRVDAGVWFENGYLRRLRSVVLTIEYVDGYTATMKYNCGSAGLVAGLRGQLSRLVRLLSRGPTELPLRSVQVRAVGGPKRVKRGEVFEDVLLPERIVEPLRRLRRVQHAKVTNDVGVDVARLLEDTMKGDGPLDAVEDDDADTQTRMSQLRVSRWKNLAEPISPAGYYPMASAPLHGFNEI